MGKQKHISAWQRYAFALTVIGITAFLRSYAATWVGLHYTFMIFLVPVMAATWFGGLGPGLVAFAIGGIVADYFFLGNPYGLHISDSYSQGRILLYTLTSLLICIVVSQLRSARMRAEENERKLHDQIAERMRAELSLREQMSERQRVEVVLKETLEKAELANRAKSEFLANMSHEIRTPMNAVVGIADILGLGKQLSPEKYKELLHTLQLSAKAMMTIIDDLLDITKIENEQVELENRIFDLRDLLEGIITILNVQAQEKHITLTLEYDKKLEGRQFYGDTTRLHQVIMNLVGNAVKFTEHGGVTLRVSWCAGATENGNDVCFEVLDTGIGIQEDKLDSIFNKFSQADTSITRKFGGTGLGLAISKMLVHIMGGTLTVTSKLGVGTLFKVYLTLCAMPIMPSQPLGHSDIDATAIPAENAYTILIVEDHAPNILIVTTILGHLNYAYRVARNGLEAAQMVRKQKFDLILMDIQMPVMDGYKATEQIREWEKQEGLARTPIIGVTAHALSEDKARCFKVGMDDYISKPFNQTHLANRIAALIYKHHRREVA